MASLRFVLNYIILKIESIDVRINNKIIVYLHYRFKGTTEEKN